MSDSGYVMSVHVDCANIYIYIYIYIYVSPSRGIHVQLGIYWYLLIFEMYLPASTHFINLNFFILLGF